MRLLSRPRLLITLWWIKLSPDWQVVLDISLSAVLATVGWFARQIWEAVQNLKKDVTAIEVNLPTHYVLRIDLEARFNKIDGALEKIYDKLYSKVDKV